VAWRSNNGAALVKNGRISVASYGAKHFSTRAGSKHRRRNHMLGSRKISSSMARQSRSIEHSAQHKSTSRLHAPALRSSERAQRRRGVASKWRKGSVVKAWHLAE